MSTWIWEQTDWPAFRWRETEVSLVLARARLAQGRILGVWGQKLELRCVVADAMSAA